MIVQARAMWRSLALGCVGLTLLSAHVAAGRQAPAAQSPQVRSWHVQGNVWLIHAGLVNVAVQIGDEGVLVVDTGTDALAEQILAEIRKLAGGRTIRYIINTSADPDHTGGNVTIAAAGRSVISGNFVPQAGQGAANAAKIIAHEHVLRRMTLGSGSRPPAPAAALPTDTFFVARSDLFFNGEAVQLFHLPNAHTDGDVLVHFRKSDVIVAGDAYINTTFPHIDVERGGGLDGYVAALHRMIEITVPKRNQEAGTYVIPGHGRLADEADVVEYYDMLAIVRDRLRHAMSKKLTFAQVKATRAVLDYEGRYAAAAGPSTADGFIEAAYQSLQPAQPAATTAARRLP